MLRQIRVGLRGDSMRHVSYCVVSHEGAWAVRLHKKYFGPCSSESQAIEVATKAAAKALAFGCSARVLVKRGDTLQVAWSEGRSHPTDSASEDAVAEEV